MLQNYAVFKNNTTAETTNKYYQECIDQKKVHIVVTAKRKYARIDYDFDTLNNARQHIKNLSKCNVGDKIKTYALQYAAINKLPAKRMPKVISDIAGGFEFYMSDIEMVGDDISKIINDIVKSGCIEYTTPDDFDPGFLAEIKEIFGKGLGE